MMTPTALMKVLSMSIPTCLAGAATSGGVILEGMISDPVATDQITVALPVFVSSMVVLVVATWKLRGMVAGRDTAMKEMQRKVADLEKERG